MRTACTLGASLALLSLSAVGAAQLFQDNFDVDSTANWGVNKSTGANANDAGSSADFFFDYSTYGISSAPNSGGGSTRGLRLDANKTGGIFSGLSVSPLGQSFAGNYTVTADVWLNFVGPLPGGGVGSTQVGGMGIGTAGTAAQWAGVGNSVHFGATGDGGSTFDYRAYSSAAPSGYADQSSVYFATGTANRNSSNAYYSVFGGQAVPAAQTGLFASQTGSTATGAAGFAWHEYKIDVSGGFATYSISGTNIARVDLSTVVLGGSNILFNYYDINATSANASLADLNFMVVDNVVVTPEPATMAALGLGVAAMLRRRRK